MLVGLIGSGKWSDNINRTLIELGALVRRVPARTFIFDGVLSDAGKLISFCRSVDAIVICSTPGNQALLFPTVAAYADALLLEKPLATDLRQLSLYENCPRLPGLLMVDHLDEVHPAVQRVIELSLGSKPSFVYYRLMYPYAFRAEMTPLFEYGPHALSLGRRFFGAALSFECQSNAMPRSGILDKDKQVTYSLGGSLGGNLVSIFEVGNSVPYKTREAIFTYDTHEFVFRDRVGCQLWRRDIGRLDEEPVTLDYEEPLKVKLRSFLNELVSERNRCNELVYAIRLTHDLLRMNDV